MMDPTVHRPFLAPSTCFAVACVAFSLLAATAIWRNQSITNSGEGKPSSAPRQRRVAVDSIYEETATADDASHNNNQRAESPLTAVAELIAVCARQSTKLRDDKHDLISAALMNELAAVTSKLCQLQNCLCSKSDAVAPGSGLGGLFIATVAGLRATLDLIDSTGKAAQSSPQSKRQDQAIQQLRAQNPAIEFLVNTLTTTELPPTPPNEETVQVEAKPIKSDQLLDLPKVLLEPPSTGLTPSIDAKGWIEPPPEYSPHPLGKEFGAEKQDSKVPLPDEPSGQPEEERGGQDAESDLYQAVSVDDIDWVRKLLLAGSDPNDTTGELQRSPLHQAAHLNHCTCLSVLLRHGAIMATEDATGDTAMHLAAWAGNVEALVSLLSYGADVDWLSGRDAYSPLWCAISASHIDAARLLLRYGARVSLRSAGGLTPLHQAAITGQSAMCELLLERGAQANAVDEDSNTPLHYAATSGSVASVRVLLQGGADVSVEQAQGLTPAHWSAHKGHTEVLKLLLDYGAPIDAEAAEGATPLHLAANRGHLPTTRLLMEKGADTTQYASAWDGVSGTPAEMAKLKGHGRVARVINASR